MMKLIIAFSVLIISTLPAHSDFIRKFTCISREPLSEIGTRDSMLLRSDLEIRVKRDLTFGVHKLELFVVDAETGDFEADLHKGDMDVHRGEDVFQDFERALKYEVSARLFHNRSFLNLEKEIRIYHDGTLNLSYRYFVLGENGDDFDGGYIPTTCRNR